MCLFLISLKMLTIIYGEEISMLKNFDVLGVVVSWWCRGGGRFMLVVGNK